MIPTNNILQGMNERDFRVCEQNPEFEMQIIQNKFC